MWERLQEVLIKFETDTKTPFYRQGSLLDKTLPDTFLTFWNTATPEGSFYDNDTYSAKWTWAIYLYSNDPSKLYTLPDEFIKLAKSEGFETQSKAIDIASGIEGYFGRFLTIYFYED